MDILEDQDTPTEIQEETERETQEEFQTNENGERVLVNSFGVKITIKEERKKEKDEE